MMARQIRRSLSRRLNGRVPRPILRFFYDHKSGASLLRGPMWVLLQTVDRCNGGCPICPYKGASQGQSNTMEDWLYLRVLEELRGVNSLRALVMMHQNEPLMDERLPMRIRQAKQILGSNIKVLTVTNGVLLTPQFVDALLAADIDEVHVSIDAVSEATFREVRPGLSFSRVTENTRSLLARAKAGQVTVRFVKQRANDGEETRFAEVWRTHGADVAICEASNRAGSLEAFERLKRNGRDQAFQNRGWGLKGLFDPVCTAPFLRLAILWDGRVSVCCEDWLNRVNVGDFSRQSLKEVWHGEPLNRYRRMIWTGQYADIACCRDCSLRFGEGEH